MSSREVTTIQLEVKPNARRSELEQAADGTWTARVAAPAWEGRANRELVALVARRFGVRQGQVRIRAGATGRVKIVEVES